MKPCLQYPCLLLLLILSAQISPAQDKTIPLTTIPAVGVPAKTLANDTIIISKGVAQKDIGDVLRQIFHSKPSKQVDSVGAKPQISIVPAIGYTLVSRLALVVSGNVAFRNGPQSRISAITASASYTQNKQFTLPVQTSIWSADNEWNFVGDYRYYQYPQSTFGLGSSSDIANEDPMDFKLFRFYQIVLKHISQNWYAGGGYMIDHRWQISDFGTKNGSFPDYRNYDEPSRTTSSGLSVNVVHDSRDNSINPAKGWYASVQYRSSLRFMGSTANWHSLLVDIRKYINFPSGSDNVLALWSYNWFILHGHAPYLDLPATSWDTNSATGRGYIQGRFRGGKMVYLEGEYRFRITGNGLLGGVFFVNAQSLSAAPGSKLQAIQPAAGPGLRIKLNKVSKTNVAIDYGFGRQKSGGLFIDVSEVF